MKRNNNIVDIPIRNIDQHKKCVAMHEAGHAAAIYFLNRAKQLPPVYFRILFRNINCEHDPIKQAINEQAGYDASIAHIEDGRLIQTIFYSIDDLAQQTYHYNEHDTSVIDDYVKALEADMLSLMIGPLAEARHVYNRDNEAFNHQLLSVEALNHYGGSSDLALIHEYLSCFSNDKEVKHKKLAELFSLAFDFINNDSNWSAINKLVDYILHSNQDVINYEEIIAVFET